MALVTQQYGFHFKSYDKNILIVIRQQIRYPAPVNWVHYTVFLPAYSDEPIIKILSKGKDAQWEVFSKHALKAFSEKSVKI